MTTLTVDGMKPLLKALQAMPAVMRTRILVPAAAKSIKTVQQAIAPLIPVNNRRGYKGASSQRRKSDHYRNVLTSAVREYPTTGTVVAMTGAESGKAPHAHLIEEGTRQRFTNSKPTYQRMAVDVKTVLKRGQLVTKAVRKKKSTGSRIKRKGNPQMNRGRMPAIHPIQRGANSVQSSLGSQLVADVSSGITREFTAAKLSRGV